MLCSQWAFIRAAGITHNALSRSVSARFASMASAERASVRHIRHMQKLIDLFTGDDIKKSTQGRGFYKVC